MHSVSKDLPSLPVDEQQHLLAEPDIRYCWSQGLLSAYLGIVFVTNLMVTAMMKEELILPPLCKDT